MNFIPKEIKSNSKRKGVIDCFENAKSGEKLRYDEGKHGKTGHKRTFTIAIENGFHISGYPILDFEGNIEGSLIKTIAKSLPSIILPPLVRN